jgi:hypothetical protein
MEISILGYTISLTPFSEPYTAEVDVDSTLEWRSNNDSVGVHMKQIALY